MNREFVLFFCALWRGAFLMILYDFLRIYRNAHGCSRRFVSIQDLLYWLLTAFYLFVGLYRENSGVIRGYLLAGLLIGMAAWQYSLSPYFVRAGSWLWRKCVKIVKLPFAVLKKVRKRLNFSQKQDRMFLCRRKR